jgi:hypothetical protein
MKTAKNSEEAWGMQDQKQGDPHGWIQWKGTSVYMGLYCKCGHLSHIDGYFAYEVKCPKCGAVYFCNGHIELIELKEPSESYLVGEPGGER